MRKETPVQSKPRKTLYNERPKFLEKPQKTISDKVKAAINLNYTPEYGTDIRTAMTKVLAKMGENPDDPANEVLKLLVSGESQLDREIQKV